MKTVLPWRSCIQGTVVSWSLGTESKKQQRATPEKKHFTPRGFDGTISIFPYVSHFVLEITFLSLCVLIAFLPLPHPHSCLTCILSFA
jgi:hypothetical protein